MSKTRKIIQPRIGIDIGRVIMAPIKGGKADTSFLDGSLDSAMQTPPSPGAFEGVKTLVNQFAGQAWLVSKAGETVQRKTKHWLRHWDFHNVTQLPQTNVRFCLKRNEKNHHCKQLKINFFIDDRLDVLKHLRDTVPHLYLFGEQPKLNDIPEWVTHVLDWEEAVNIVLDDLNLHRHPEMN